MEQRKSRIATATLLGLLLVLASALLLFGVWPGGNAANAATDKAEQYAVADSVYDFTFTDSAALASKWGAQAATVQFDHYNRTMQIAANQQINGTVETGSYHTKFDIKFGAGNWFSMFLRHNSGAGRTKSDGDYKSATLDLGEYRGYRLNIGSQYMEFMEHEGPIDNATLNALATSAPIDTATPLGSDKWYTFEIWVLNLTDGSVQFIVDVDGTTYINKNTADVENSIFDEPITSGSLRIFGSNVATEYRGYESKAAQQPELFTRAQFDNWTGNGGAGGSAPMAWVKGGYEIGEFTEKTGWPTSLTNATALIGSSEVGGFSSQFTFTGDKVADPADANQPYNLQLSYLAPDVKTAAWMGNAKNGLLNEENWVNGYTIRLNLKDNTIVLLVSNNAGETCQMYWHNNGVNFADGQAHTFYWAVQNAPDRSYQIVTLEVDGKTLIDYHSDTPWSRVGGGTTDLTDEQKNKFLVSCPVGSYQIVTQGITGTFANAGDKQFAQDYFVTDMSPIANNPQYATDITLQDGVLTVPRGDKNGENGEGWQDRECVAVVTNRKISANSVIAFDFSAERIEGKTIQLFFNLNNNTQYPTTGNRSGAGTMYVLFDAGSSQLPLKDGNVWYSAGNILDGKTHRVVIASHLINTGLAVQYYADGACVLNGTYTDESYFHDGYFNMYSQGLDNITVSNLSVYEDSFATVKSIRLTGTPKTDYIVGDELDVSGLNLTAVYNDGTHTQFAVTEEMVSGFDNENPSDSLTLTVTYQGATATFDVVMDAGNEPVYTVKSGFKDRYKVGEEYAGDITVVKTFEGEKTEIPVTAELLGESFTTALGGEVTLTFTVEGKELTATIFVEKELTGMAVASGYKQTYDVGVAFDYEDLKGKLQLSFNDGTQENADITPDMLSRRGARKGQNVITVRYAGFEDTLTITGSDTDAWNADGDESKRAALTDINIADGSVMARGGYATAMGDTVAFGPSNGGFVAYATAEKAGDYRMEFDMKIPSTAADANQRILLRSSIAANDGMDGYFVLIYKTNLQLYRKPTNSVDGGYYRIAAASFTEEQIGGTNIYDDTYHRVEVEGFNRDNGAVVFNIAIDGVHVLHCVDDGTQEKIVWEDVTIPEADRRVYAENGFVGFTMNSAAAWMLKGQYADASFAADTYLGNENLYDPRGTVNFAGGGTLSFRSGNVAYAAEEVASLRAEFTLKCGQSADGEWFAVAPMATKSAVTSFDTANGWIVKFYADRAEITLSGKVYATLTGDFAVDRAASVKLSVGALGGESLIGLCVDGEWIGASAPSGQTNTSGYFGLYAFAAAELTAETEAERNFRVLFVGNSITNHGPNPDIGYGIGDGAESWGMATSAPEFDYVHLVMAQIRAIAGYEDAEFMALNVASWEREYATFDYVRYYADGAAFEPDLIVGRLGENAQSCTAAYIRNNDFTHYYDKLLSFFDSKGTAQIVLTTSYWGDAHYDRDSGIDARIVELARKKGYPLVRLGDLGSKHKDVNDASADGEYYKNLPGTAPAGHSWEQEWNNWSSAVKSHPGMVGMRNIAARIAESVTDLLTGGTGEIFVYEEVADGLYAEYMQSELSGTAAGAYDYSALTVVKVSAFGDASAYTFADNYRLYKAYAIEKTGDIYRLSMPLYADTDANFTFKVYTLAADGTLTELYFYNDSESNPEPTLSVDGTTVGTALFVTVEYNAQSVFTDRKLNDVKFGNLLKWINSDSDTFTLDVSELEYDNLTVGASLYATLVAAGKDLEIRFAHGTITVDIDTLEVITATEHDLYFSVTGLSGNFLRAATSAVKGLDESYEFLSASADGYVNEVYETQISYDNRNGDALYLSKGVRVQIPVTLTDAQVARLVVVTATLPAIGSDVRCVDLLDFSAYSYADGTLTLALKDFDCDVILALGEERKATLALKEGYKTEYEVGDALSVENMTLVYTAADGTATEVAVTAEMVSGFTSETAGTVEITVTYEGLTVKANITVKEKTAPTPVPEEKKCGCNGCNSDLYAEAALVAFALLAATAIVLCVRKRKQAK